MASVATENTAGAAFDKNARVSSLKAATKASTDLRAPAMAREMPVARTYTEASQFRPGTVGYAGRSYAGRVVVGPLVQSAITRLIEAQGYSPVHARSMMQDIVRSQPGPERGREGDDARPKRRSNGKLYIHCGKVRESAKFEVPEDADLENDPDVRGALARFVEKVAKELVGWGLAAVRPMEKVFLEFLHDHQPIQRELDESWDDYLKAVGTCEQLEEYFLNTRFADLRIDAGLHYARFRVDEPVKTVKVKSDVAPGEEEARRKTKLRTAAKHVYLLQQILAYFSDKHGLPSLVLKKPKVPSEETFWLTGTQWTRLYLAARGWMFDEAGRKIGYDRRLRERFDAVVRLIMLYTFGGTRHGNIYELIWAQDLFRGHIDLTTNTIKRQGMLSKKSNKRRGTSKLLGSLPQMALGWKAKDDGLRKGSLIKFVNIVHRQNGLHWKSPMRSLWTEVVTNAGLPDWITPHHLKHSGVTFAALAGMTTRQISLAFSTSMRTLEETYTHLHSTWEQILTYDPSKLNLRNIKRLTGPSAEEYYGGVVPLPLPPGRRRRNALPLATPMRGREKRLYTASAGAK